MKFMSNRSLSIALLVGFVAATAAPQAVAGSSGRKNTAIGLTAGSIYLLSKNKDTLGLVGVAGSAYAWQQYSKSRKTEVKRAAYKSGYTAGRTTSSSRSYSSRSTAVPVRYAAPKPKPIANRATSLTGAGLGTSAIGLIPSTIGDQALVAPLTSFGVHPAAYGLETPYANETSTSLPWLLVLAAFVTGIIGTVATMRFRTAAHPVASAPRVVTLGTRRT